MLSTAYSIERNVGRLVFGEKSHLVLVRKFPIEEKMFVFLAKCTKAHSIPLSTLSTWKGRVRMQKK